jgi:hypothetical protein
MARILNGWERMRQWMSARKGEQCAMDGEQGRSAPVILGVVDENARPRFHALPGHLPQMRGLPLRAGST